MIEFQTTAPPSRVNFREIRGPGVREENYEPANKNWIQRGQKNVEYAHQ